MNKRMAALMATGLMVAALLTGCGGDKAASGGDKAGGSEVKVSLKSTQFNPKKIEIKAGQTVTWVNEDVVDHSIYEGEVDNANPAFKSADFGTGKSFSHTFDKAGEYKIWCNTGGHGLIGMTMTVVVK